MNGVVGMADYLISTPLSNDQARCVRTIQAASTALRRILDDILDLSRLESNRLELVPAVFDPREVIDNVLGLFEADANRRGLVLVSRVAPDLPPRITTDSVRLGQILANLVGNAIKFTQRGGVTVELDWLDAALRLRVTDTGIGIPEAARAKLFSRFTQVDASTTRTYGGSGLGLAICRELLDLMGGHITLEAPEDGGSRFTVFLPVALAETPEALPLSLQPTPEIERNGPSGLAVLVVDDNDINREVATRLLCKIGCAAESVAHGEAALDLLRERTFDVVFMDVQMPGMDGYETTRRIRAAEVEARQARTPIIALTADAVEGVEENCRTAGMDSFLTKPVTRRSLAASLTAYQGRNGGGAS
jgi:CheY-like chemotaxis protein